MLFCRHDCRFEQNDKNTEIQKESLTNGKNKYTFLFAIRHYLEMHN